MALESGSEKKSAIVLVAVILLIVVIFLVGTAFLANKLIGPRPGKDIPVENFGLGTVPTSTGYALSLSQMEGITQDSNSAYEYLSFFPDLRVQPTPDRILAHEEKLELTGDQKSQLEELDDSSEQRLQDLAKQIVEREKNIRDLVVQENRNQDDLRRYVQESASLYAQLRQEVLDTQMAVLSVLSKEQVVLLSQQQSL